MKISVYTIGCKVNQYESDSIIKALTDRGHEVIDSLNYADIYIINTCAVTREAERKSRQCIARAKKLNANAKIYIIGCASEHNAGQFSDKDDVIFVSGTANKSKLVLFEQLEGESIVPLPIKYEDDLTPLSLRTRSYIKVQDGCNNFCSYCILPYLRGRSRSRSIESIITEYKETAKVSNEIVLTGINLSAFGKDIDTSLVELLKQLKGIGKRLRLGSLEVNIIDRELLEILTSIDEFCPQFHLSLQSGDDKILKDMNRHYSKEEFYHKVQLIREYFPDAAITTDIIVGYPTEGEVEFNSTLELAERVGFSHIHCFPYSRRDGTKAAKLAILDSSIVNDRMSRLETLRNKLTINYNQKFIGKHMEVLIEEESKGLYQGYSRNYIKVYSSESKPLKEITIITPSNLYEDGLIG